MAIVSQLHWRNLSSWGVWLIVALVMLLLPWRTLPPFPCSQPTVIPATTAGLEQFDLWQSPFDPFPWFSRRIRAHWQAAWH